MTEAALVTLRAVLAETPLPPQGNVDPFDVISAVERMAARRQRLLDELPALLGENPTADGEGAEILAELRERNARWQAALSTARHALGDRRSSLERLKRANRPWNP